MEAKIIDNNNPEITKAKIVWVSDIHLRGSYSKDKRAVDKLDSAYKAFLKKISEEQEIAPIDYVFLTGDIGFSGSVEDYNYFWEWFITPLYDYYLDASKKQIQIKFPKIIVIPGNHDISWDSTVHFEKYLTSYNTNTGNFKERNELIANTSSRPDFIKSFKHYTESFSRSSGSSVKSAQIWEKFFDLSNLEVSADYNTERLFGFVIDHNKKLIIILLNTSWFSIGVKFNELLITENITSVESKINFWDKITMLKKGLDNFFFKAYSKQAKSLLAKKERIVEYGNQIIGRDIYPTPHLMEAINKNPEYIIISCMHHPMNWLSWNELNSYDKSDSEDFTLNKILSKTDLLLTGHEHLPIFQKPVLLTNNSKGYHLMAGMFMEDQINAGEGQKSFSHSRFSILDIDVDEYKVIEKRFLFNNLATGTAWVKQNDDYDLPLAKKKKYLTEARALFLKNSISKFDVVKFLETRMNWSGLKKEFITSTDSNYIVYKLLSPTGCRFCVLPLTQDFLEIILPNKYPDHFFIDELVSKIHDQEVTIHFIWLDLLINADLTNNYYAERIDHDINFGHINSYSDMLFNKFRHKYFERFCDPDFKQVDFNTVKEVKFVNQPLPYWVFSRYCS